MEKDTETSLRAYFSEVQAKIDKHKRLPPDSRERANLEQEIKKGKQVYRERKFAFEARKNGAYSAPFFEHFTNLIIQDQSSKLSPSIKQEPNDEARIATPIGTRSEGPTTISDPTPTPLPGLQSSKEAPTLRTSTQAALVHR